MIKAVLFDLFGTVVAYGDGKTGTRLAWTGIYNVLAEQGLAVPYETFVPEWERQFQTPLAPDEDRFQTPFLSKMMRLMTHYGLPTDEDAALRAVWACLNGWDQHIFLPDDCYATLDALRRTHKVILVSNFDHPPYVRQMLDHHALTERFDDILISGELRVDKPDPRIFRAGLDAAGCEANEAVFVGDNTRTDIAGARAAGIPAVLIDRRKRHVDDHAAQTPWYINELEELPDVMVQINAQRPEE